MDTDIISHNQDARLFLSGQPDEPYDLILADAFNDFSVPYHLTTREFNQQVRAWLAEDGLYLVNIIDGPQGDFLRAYTYTLQQTFGHVYLAPTITGWREAARSTFVLVASDEPLDLAVLQDIDAGDGVALLHRQILDPADLESLLAQGKAVVLTDRYAPVDQMLAPTIREEVPQ